MNNRVQMQAHNDALQAAWDRDRSFPSFRFTVTERFVNSHAELSWIRSAYLAAFAALGWRYILRPELQPIRDQIKNPETKILPRLSGFNPEAPTDRKGILLVESPNDLRGVFVTIGRHGVFLPGPPWAAQSCSELSQAITDWSAAESRHQMMLSGKEVPWPKNPMYLLDPDSD
ncbi:hypothetical protein [Streptomyces zinciresistens]|uniref:hypothetical protein n=1 Tax=Streptomyces zinciresistens TaxID=1073330 RepID=UPI001FCC7219|nr:hypothetical protein [Streptomyces zinciresistens]